MKKAIQSIFSIILALLLFSSQAIAYTNSATAINSESEIEAIVDFDEAEIYSAFDEVSELVSTIESSDVSYSDLETTNSNLLTNVSSIAAISMSTTSSDNPPIISAFLWGCFFNWAGMLVVGLTTDFDNEQIMKSGWGCLLSSFFWGGGLIFF
ncbi:MAG: hypothetical protein PF541_18115 [Prolixibacteraceae bacterium]|jgi:hypothetical protein|nr:hypothetical protein [Prolixibacteraceae bacterium]